MGKDVLLILNYYYLDDMISYLFIYPFRKHLKKGVLLYIHVNFIIALALALLVFVTGIETATKIRVYLLCVTLAQVMIEVFNTCRKCVLQ